MEKVESRSSRVFGAVCCEWSRMLPEGANTIRKSVILQPAARELGKAARWSINPKVPGLADLVGRELAVSIEEARILKDKLRPGDSILVVALTYKAGGAISGVEYHLHEFLSTQV